MSLIINACFLKSYKLVQYISNDKLKLSTKHKLTT